MAFPSDLHTPYTLVDNTDSVMAAHPNTLSAEIRYIENKIGLDNSSVATSIDYFLKHVSGNFRNHQHDGGSDDGAAVIGPLTALSIANDVDVGNYEIRALTFESDQATGTAPFTVASTTVVTNLNADQIDGLHSTSLVQTSGTQTITGVKTFSSFPVTPSSAPTTNYQTSNKKYVDDSIAAISFDFGDWVDCSSESARDNELAATNGFVVGYNGAGASAEAIVYTDENSNPSTVRVRAYNDPGTATGQFIPFCVPVKKGHYWRVTGSVSACFWIPLGN